MSQLRVNSIGNLSGTKIDTTDDIVDVGFVMMLLTHK
jgi:hypothetical protein